jgi:hypothetical protein
MLTLQNKIGHVGNFRTDDLNVPTPNNHGVPMIEQWRAQGIGHLVTEPVATERYSTEQLASMGLVGVTFIKPVAEEQG